MVLSELMNLELNKPVFSDGLENVNAVFYTEETKICLEIYFSASKRYYSSSNTCIKQCVGSKVFSCYI